MSDDAPAYTTVPRHLVQAIVDIRADIQDSDGDTRGMVQALSDAELALIETAVNEIT